MQLKLFKEDLIFLYLISFIFYFITYLLFNSPAFTLDIIVLWMISIGLVIFGLRNSKKTFIIIGSIVSIFLLFASFVNIYTLTGSFFGSSLSLSNRFFALYQFNQFWLIPVFVALLNSLDITIVPEKYRSMIINKSKETNIVTVQKETAEQKKVDSNYAHENANRYYQMQNYEQALQYCNRATDLNYYNRKAWYLKAQILQNTPSTYSPFSFLREDWQSCYDKYLQFEPESIEEWQENVELIRFSGKLNAFFGGDKKANDYIEKAERKGIFLSGKMIVDTSGSLDYSIYEGHGQLEITNPTDQGIIVILTKENTLNVEKAFTVRAFHSYTIGKIRPASYSMYCILGKNWNWKTKKFDNNEHYKYYTRPLEFLENWDKRKGDIITRVSWDIRYNKLKVKIPDGLSDISYQKMPKLAF